jgi:hypothetical protein
VFLVCAEIQELRHKSQGSSDASGANNEIDQLLVSLDERLESVSKGVKAVTETLEPILTRTSFPSGIGADGEIVVMIRKHAALMAEWEAAKAESETLRDELKEDKWLIVFRTVTEQAGGLMSSLEKGVNRCQVRLNPRYRLWPVVHLRPIGLHHASSSERRSTTIVDTVRQVPAHFRIVFGASTVIRSQEEV